MKQRPRRFDDPRREQKTRINDMIRVREVLLIDEKGENLGVKTADDAKKYAWDLNLDLVEISPQARPPVCRVMDFGKWKYEQDIKAKQARRNKSQITVKEIKFRPKIGDADYMTKLNHVKRFLGADDKVKITIMFRGREVVHHDLGRNILDRVAEDIEGIGVVEQTPNLEGRNMTMLLAPAKKKDAKNVESTSAESEGSDVDAGVAE